MTTYGADTFTRANTTSPSWGTATDGQTWAHVLGTATTYSVTSNEGVIANTPGTWDSFKLGSTSVSTTLEVTVHCILDNTTSNFGVLLYLDGTGNTSYMVIYDGVESKGFILYDNRSGLTQLAQTSFSVTAGQGYWVKANISSGTLKGKIWHDTGGEPGTWNLTAAATAITSGGFGILGAANSNLKFDNFTATDGSTATTSAQSVTESYTIAETLTVADLASFTETLAVTETRNVSVQAQIVDAPTVTETQHNATNVTQSNTTPISETVSTAFVSYQLVTDTTQVLETVQTSAPATLTDLAAINEQINLVASSTQANTTSSTDQALAYTVWFTVPTSTTTITEAIQTSIAATLAHSNAVTEVLQLIDLVTLTDTSVVTETINTQNVPVTTSTDPNAQMLYDDLQIQYSRIVQDATLAAKIQLIGFTYYLPSKIYSEHAIPGEIDVLLNNETISQLHVLKTINNVTDFITTYG